MTFGARVKNSDSDILIDSDFSHYHYIGKASHYGTTRVPDITGGNFTDHSPTYHQGLAATQLNCDIVKYRITTANGTTPPMCFIKPAVTGSSGTSCAIILTKKVPNQYYIWEVWVLQTRGHVRPTLYCFYPLRYFNVSQKTLPSTETVGVAMYNSGGQKTFDTRYKPLKIIKTQTINAPAMARTSSPDNGTHAPSFTPNGSTDYTHGLSSSNDLMFYAPSLAHSCQQAYEQRDGEGFQTAGNNSYFYKWVRADLWWCFYRNTFKINGSKITSGYDIYASGHVFEANEDDSSIIEVALGVFLGVITGGAATGFIAGFLVASNFNNAGITAGSYYPYQDDSRNASEDVNVLWSRPSYYD